MPRKYFRKYLPTPESLQRYRWGRMLLGSRMHHPNLWHLNRRSVASGVSIGMFAGLIPGPLQMISAALLSMVFRANLPVAVFTTLYTNPLTIVPLYALAYEYGAFLLGHAGKNPTNFNLPDMTWSNWIDVLPDWFMSLGKPFALGLPMLAITLSVLGYIVVRLAWRGVVSWEWYRRIKKRKLKHDLPSRS